MNDFYKNIEILTGLDKSDIEYILKTIAICSAQDLLNNDHCEIPKIINISKDNTINLNGFYKKYIELAKKGKSPIDKAATESYQVGLKNKLKDVIDFDDD